ncbi:MAG: siphovirus Gp157 family protein [Lachnospiraceae bacterium]|nr:siphovirus Gp157 family protein [Lachnospiraceae bacterium]
MSTLYQLTADFEEVINMLYDEDVDEQVILDTLEGIEMEFEDKADGYAKVDKQMKADIEAMKAERDRLSERISLAENRRKRLLWKLENAMRTTGKTKFKTALFSFGIQKNGGKQPVAIDAADVTLIPAAYLIPQPPVPDKEKIREYLQAGNKPAWAHLEPRGESLRIR